MKKAILADSLAGDLAHGLAMLLHSGISVSEGLFLLAQEETGGTKELLETMGRKTEQGISLAAAMEESLGFSRYVCGLVRVGEDTGRLEESLQAISDYCLERCRVTARLRNAITYPAIILALMLAVIGVLLIQVLPIFDRVYASLGSGLTGIPALLLNFGQILAGALPWILGFVLLLAVGLAAVLLILPLKEGFFRFFRSHFGDRGMARKFHNARFLRGLAMGLLSGLMLEDAANLACSLLEDAPGAKERGRRCAESLSWGVSLAEALEENQLLPASESRLLAVGIRSGQTDRIMAEIADRLQEDAANSLDRRIARIEPAMVLTASVLVGLILLSVMLPLLQMMNALG